jgi:hypothetical protein
MVDHPYRRRKKAVVVCVEWYHMHPTKDPRFWHEVGTKRVKRGIRKHDYTRLKLIVREVAIRRNLQEQLP